MADHVDTLAELARIGAGRAAAVLNDVLATHVRVCVPEVCVVTPDEARGALEALGRGRLVGVGQAFGGGFEGGAAFVLPHEVASRLVDLLTGGHHDTDVMGPGVLTEVGSVVLGCLAASLSGVPGAHLDAGLAWFREGSPAELHAALSAETAVTVVVCPTRIDIGADTFHGVVLAAEGSGPRVVPTAGAGPGRQVPAGVCVVEPSWRVDAWNDTLSRWSGIAADVAVGSDLRDHFSLLRRPQVQRRVAAVLRGGPPVVLSGGIHTNLVPGGVSDAAPGVQDTTVVPVPAADGSAATWARLVVVGVTDTAGAPAGRVLLVEDDRVNRVVAERQLRSLGWAVDVVVNGADAVDAVTAAADRYDLVLMDCHMPVMDGFAAARAIRAAEGGGRPRSRILALTASDLDADRDACLAAGMDGFVAKPICRDELAAVLAQV